MYNLPEVKVFQPDNPLDQYARLMQIKQMQQSQQTNQLQQQGLQQENQMRAQQIQDQQAFRTAMTDPSMQGKTMGDVADALAHRGAISQAGWAQLKKADLEYRSGLAGLDEKTLANQAAAHTQSQQIYNNVMNMPDAQVAANWPQIAQQFNAIPGNEKQPLNPQQPMTKQQLQQFGPMMSMGNAYFDQELARRQKIAEASSAETAAQKAQQDLVYGPTGAAAEGKYRFILQKIQAGTASPDEVAWAKSQEASQSKTTTQSDSLGVTSSNTSRPAGIATAQRQAQAVPGATSATPAAGAGTPSSNKNSLVDMIGNYKLNPQIMSRMITKHPDVLAAVSQKYPDWDQTNYNAKNKIIEGYTSGTQSKEINAINTAMGHLDDLDSAIAALNNNDITALNKLGNKIGINLTGQTAAAAYQTILHRVGPEVTAAYIPGAGGEGERLANEKDFSADLPPQTLHNNIAVSVNLLRSKIGALENQYKNQVGRDDFQTRFITPQAQASIQRFAGQQQGAGGKGGFTVTDPRGVVHTFSSQQQADSFKKAAGL